MNGDTVDNIRLQGTRGETIWKNNTSKMSMYTGNEKSHKDMHIHKTLRDHKFSPQATLKAQSTQEITKGLHEHGARP